MQLGPTYRERHADIAGVIPRERFTTIVIMLINSGLYAAMTLYSLNTAGPEAIADFTGRTLVVFGAKHPLLIEHGQWWRYVTAGFLHAGLLHFAMNSWVLFDLGREVESFFGTARFLVIYFVSSVAGFVLSNWWSASISVGASAAIFGLIGAMIALGTRTSTSMGSMMRAHYGRWAVYGLLMSVLPFFAIDLAAHLGGLIGGFAIGFIAGEPKLAEGAVNKLWRFAAACCVLATAACFALVFLQFVLA
jgi:rhomboid protease GluP